MCDFSGISFENENARLIFEDVKEYYDGFSGKEIEITEDMALAMYYHINFDAVPPSNDVIYIPIYNVAVS